MMEKLSSLPNIGQELEQRLQKIGVITASELVAMGSCKAFQLFHAHEQEVCVNMLYALVGAV